MGLELSWILRGEGSMDESDETRLIGGGSGVENDATQLMGGGARVAGDMILTFLPSRSISIFEIPKL